MLSQTPDIIILTETNLNNSIGNNELGLDDFIIFRRDRYEYGGATNGGGILIAVKHNLSPLVIINDYTTPCEQLFIQLKADDKNLIIGAVYLPPMSSSDTFSYHVNTVENLFLYHQNDSEFLIVGDFNLPKTHWINSLDSDESLDLICYHDYALIKYNSTLLVNSFSYLNFRQIIDVHDKKGYTLDLCFTTLEHNQISNLSVTENLFPLDKHHNPSLFSLNFAKIKNIQPVFAKKNYFKADFDKINVSINLINWDQLLTNSEIEFDTDVFNSKLQEIINTHVPDRKENNNSTYPPWFSFDLIKLTIIKKKLHKIWLSTDHMEDGILFKRQRAICLRRSRLDQKTYFEEIQKKTQKNAKEFWRYVSNLSKKNTIPEFVFYKGYTSASTIDSCNLFSAFFKSTYSPTVPVFTFQDFEECSENEINFSISRSEIISAVKNLSDNVFPGTDTFPEIFVKKCCDSLINPLFILYNRSLGSGTVPCVWKKSFVTPIYKAGDKSNVENYRPISILGAFAKVLDSIISSKLTLLLLSKISTNQHGFVENKSTLTNLLIYSEFISSALNSGTQVDSIYLDFSKAFDSVNHDILIRKLFNFGVRGSILSWLKSYLINREYQVRIKGNLSNVYYSNSGVPQGSHLGPLLFLLFINDIDEKLQHSKILLYADDVKLFNTINSPLDQTKLQKDLDTISEWARLNDLNFNINKCSVVTFRRGEFFDTNYLMNDVTLTKVSSQKDLGVTFQENFEFDMHLNTIVNKAYKVLGFVIRSSSNFNCSTLISLFKTLIRSILLYNSQIWTPHYDVHIKKLESVQHKFFRYLAHRMGSPFSFDEHDYSAFAKKVNLTSIKSLHNYYDMLFVKRTLFIESKRIDVIADLFIARESRIELRNPRPLREFFSNKDYVFYSVMYRLRRSWNRLDVNVKSSASMNEFKNELFNSICDFV